MRLFLVLTLFLIAHSIELKQQSTLGNKMYRIPLKKKPHQETHQNSFLQVKGTQQKVTLTNYKNTQYVGEVAVGKKDNTFKVIFDTGSGNIWLDSKKCQDDACKNHKQYDASESKSYKSKGSKMDVQFGTGELIGEVSTDKFYIGGLKIEEQDFTEITEEVGEAFKYAQFDGIVGMAYNKMASYRPLFDSIMKEKKLENNVFSFLYDRNENESTSELILGGWDERVKDIHWHAVSDKYFWSMKADNILVDGEDIGLCEEGCHVIADTGTSLLTGPQESVMKLVSKLNIEESCANVRDLKKVTFVLDGVNYDLEYKDYVVRMDIMGRQYPYGKKVDGDSECVSAFMPLEIPQQPSWLLGDTFLSKYYTIFDRENDRVGFGVVDEISQ